MKMLNKMRKSEKGFTLIELIVVIAILAILAAIAIPRLAGFTDQAKKSNDEELASIVAHSIQTLIASGDIEVTAGGGSMDVAGAVGTDVTYTPTDLTYVGDEADLQTALEALIGVKAFKYYSDAVITVADTGDIDIEADIAYTK